MKRCDVAVIGSGPAGQKAAIQAAKAGKRVVIIERAAEVGGGCVHSGTIPSKTLREAALQLSGARRLIRGARLELGDDFALDNLMTQLGTVIEQHEAFWRDQLERNAVEVVRGSARFVDGHTLEVSSDGDAPIAIGFGAAIIATGSRPRKVDLAAVDDEVIFDSDSVLSISGLPRSMLVLGAGVIASEYASIFACLGVEVTMIDNRERPVPFADPELTDRFVDAFRDAGGTYLPERNIFSVRRTGSGVVAEIEGTLHESIEADAALVALGRVANSDSIGLCTVGVTCCPRGTIVVDENGWTGVEQIYAVGDVVGPPALASTSMDQGRRAARTAVGLPAPSAPEMIPAGIYTIPAISFVGKSEAETTRDCGDAVVGRARYDEIARGCIAGDRRGLLKLIFDPSQHRLVGVHVVGTGATDLVHVGQVALAAGWCIDDFIDNVFNFPTFAEAYRVAALDAAKMAGRAAARDDGIERLRRASSM